MKFNMLGDANHAGPVRLSDVYSSQVGDASQGVAASQKALYDAYNSLNSRFKATELWVNSNTAVQFLGQSVSVNLSSYLLVCILYYESANATNVSTTTGSTIFLKGQGVIVYHTKYSGGAKISIGRRFSANNSSVGCTDGYRTTINTTATQAKDNTAIVPVRIYGVL